MKNLWTIRQDNYNSCENTKYETIFTLANGYRGLRGTLEFSKIGHRGNFIAGVYNQAEAFVTEIVNCQDPLVFNLYIDGELMDIDKCKVSNCQRYLDMKQGLLITELTLETSTRKITKIKSIRFVSRNNPNRWGIKYFVTPVNYSGKIYMESIIDGTVSNSISNPVNKTKHINVDKLYDLKPGIGLKSITKDKGIEIIEGIALKATNNSGNMLTNRKYCEFGESVRELYGINVKENEEHIIEKYGVTYTSRDVTENLLCQLQNNLNDYISNGLENEMELHIAKWDELWDKIDIKIVGDEEAQLGIRFNLYQLSSSAYDGDDRVSIAAKALHGEGYKGHIFWDTEIFMLPFFIYTNPSVAKALLMYRYNTLNGARKNAISNGYLGAQFAWESADDGKEVTPRWLFDDEGNSFRLWIADEEFHINADIAFGVWQYYRTTLDKEFLINYGLEIIFETSKFWCSRLEYSSEYDRYELCKVIGPDEFHEHVNNNAYTNYLAKWNLKKALDLVNWIKEKDYVVYERLCNKLSINDEDFAKWKENERKIYIPCTEGSKLIEQFEGYFDLADIEIEEYDHNGMPIWPDLQGHSMSETQLIKQADVVMLMLLLQDEFDDGTRKENYEYYEKRVMHKSSLSPSMYSIMGISVDDTSNAYDYFMKAVMTDLKDNQGNTSEGLHAASTGGVWQSVVFGFGGMYVDKEQCLCFKPWIPEKWKELSFNVCFRGIKLKATISKDTVIIESDSDIKIKVYDINYEIEKNKEVIVKRKLLN